MPISRHYGGHGKSVMAHMVSEYGAKKGKQVFYATENKQKQERRKKDRRGGK